MKVLIPMAGAGSRFQKVGYDLPKPLIIVNGRTLIEHSIRSFDVDADYIFVTRKFDNPVHNQQLSQLLQKLKPGCREIQIEHLTNGSSETCLCAKDLINNDEPLVTYNCDQIYNWDAQEFLRFIGLKKPHGAVVLYNSTDPKNSFACIEHGKITRLVEKQPITNHALVGFHYWAHGKDFVWSAQQLVDNFHLTGQPECYVSETYNYLISRGDVILPYHIHSNRYIPLGTPEDVAKYMGQLKQSDSMKQKTIFCNIDGTLVAHSTFPNGDNPVLLARVREKFQEWNHQGHRIILITSAKESGRASTEKQLSDLGLAWDQMIMGVGTGTSYLINPKPYSEHSNKAVAINTITDQGLDGISWDDYDL